MSRDNAFYAAIAAFVLLLVAWWVSATHWVDVEVRVPPTGEAITNDLWAVQNLARALGVRVTVAGNLETMPPARATLVLDRHSTDLLEEQSAALRDWVRQGGHLVLPAFALPSDSANAVGTTNPKPPATPADAQAPESEDAEGANDADDAVETPLSEWIVLRKRELPARQLAHLRAQRAQAEKAATPARAGAVQRLGSQPCRALQEQATLAEYFLDGQPLRLCNIGENYTVLAPTPLAALWALDGERGQEALRVRFGSGQVTAVVPWELLSNRDLPRGDHPLLAAAALQLRAGGDVWFLSPQKRQGLIAWLWDRAWPGLCLALLAIAAALWRAAPRLGPVMAPLERSRRSMREQVLGTAEFLRQHGRAALLRAQARALRETARRRLRRTPPDAADGALSPVQQQTQAIAKACGMDAVALEQAFNLADQSSGKITAQALTQALVLLNAAQRQLAQRR